MIFIYIILPQIIHFCGFNRIFIQFKVDPANFKLLKARAADTTLAF